MELAQITEQSNLLPRPSQNSDACRRLSSWAEEALWGHRLWYRQSPWLLFLEYLNVAEASWREGKLFENTEASCVPSYGMYQRLLLRNLLFNNPSLSRIQDSKKPDIAKWDEWIRVMNEDSEPPQGDYAFLRERFAKFDDFANTVELLRQTVIDPLSDRRWCSRFIFPFGPLAIYEDLAVKDGTPEKQYINFGRAGNLLYTMLCRSSVAKELAGEFNRLFALETIPHRMVERLQRTQESPSGLRPNGYLPYREHPSFDRLGEDWLAVLRLQLPAHDAYAHLVPLGALHLLIYQMETAAAWLSRHRPIFVCEVIAPRMEFVRQRATQNFQDNDGLPWTALERYVSSLMDSEEWKAKVDNPNLLESERLDAGLCLLEHHLWMKREEFENCTSLAHLRTMVEDRLRDKLDDNLSQLHSTYGRGCGLVSKRGARNYRYAPSDTLLKTLLFTNVHKRMEMGEFLRVLYERYGFVFGPTEASCALPEIDYDQTAFQKNRERLEERLRSMGLLNRLSDGCAYVENRCGRDNK